MFTTTPKGIVQSVTKDFAGATSFIFNKVEFHLEIDSQHLKALCKALRQ
jgi:hypothetical protein